MANIPARKGAVLGVCMGPRRVEVIKEAGMVHCDQTFKVVFLRAMKRSTIVLLSVLLRSVSAFADTSDVWGAPPEASDDRFTNPDKPLYAGPDGWWNTGEVRAKNDAGDVFQFKGSFIENNALFIAVKDLQALSMDFGTATRPAPGEYKIGSKGDMAAKTVRFSFSITDSSHIREWTSNADAGELAVKLVHGFTVFTCRGVVLHAASTAGDDGNGAPITLGFEGALSPED